jgi:hypothetical protein
MRIPVSLKNESKNDSLAARGSHQLSEDRGSSDQASAPECSVQRRLGSGANAWIAIPERHFPTEPG